MEGDLETAPLQVLNEVQIVGIVQGLRTSEVTTALRAGNRPYRLGRPQSKPFEQAVDGTDIGYGRDIGIVDDGEGESLSLRPALGLGRRRGGFLPGSCGSRLVGMDFHSSPPVTGNPFGLERVIGLTVAA